MASDGQIVFEVTADGKHAIADIKDITRAIQQETGKWDDSAQKSADNMSNSFTSMLKKLTAAFSAAKIGQALLNFGKDAISAASDLQEVQNVVDVTFGSNANVIEKWAKTASTAFGLTETQAKRYTSTIGAMLKSSGIAESQIVDVSTDLAGLAADMASFYNLDFDEAFSKIRSGISGQTMPLKELGIDLSVATLNAYALKSGLEKTYEQMDQGEQTMLRYQYLMSATSDAQGDFARTSDSYANSVRTLQTEVETLKTTLGAAFLDVVTGAIGALNDFIAILIPEESSRTVLDDFADIDLKTSEKIAAITETANEANTLVAVLDEIGGSKADTAGSKVQQMADDLSNISFDEGKTGAFTSFLDTLSSNVDIISGITGESADGVQDWINNIAESAGNLNENDAQGWAKLIESIKEFLPGIENTDFGQSFFSQLTSGFEDVEAQSSVLSWAVDMLGNKTNKTAEEQALWLETCKRLVSTIPGLSSIINTETGEVKGGTQAVKDYIKAWEEGQTKLAMTTAYEQKESALAQKYSELSVYELDMATAQHKVREQANKIRALYKQYGIREDLMPIGTMFSTISGAYANLPIEEMRELNGEVMKLQTLQEEETKATDEFKKQKDACDEAAVSLKEYRETIDEMPGEIDNATEATDEWREKVKLTDEEITNLVNDAKTAIEDLDSYVAQVRANVESSVNSAIKGFAGIETDAEKTIQDLTEELNGLDSSADDYAEKAAAINEKLSTLGSSNSTVSSQNMNAGLRDQIAYMDEYLAYLEQAREMGFSNEVLANFTDGSTESYNYLAALAGASDDEVEEINSNYQAVIDKKKELTEALTGQQLSADETYKSLAAAAKEAVAQLDLAEEAKDNAGKTIEELAKGISDHVPDVQTAVDAIVEQLNRLSSWGINIDLAGFGTIELTTGTGAKEDGSALMGMSNVPWDGYIARLHKDEGILTAEENRVWQGLQNGALNNVDLDSLGGVINENVNAGGNVYLDGKIVGAVVSERQGKSYKSLTRSGWQA